MTDFNELTQLSVQLRQLALNTMEKQFKHGKIIKVLEP